MNSREALADLVAGAKCADPSMGPTLEEIAAAEKVLDDERLHYIGCLGLLANLAVYVSEEDRGLIEEAFRDAEQTGLIRWRRILDSFEVHPA